MSNAFVHHPASYRDPSGFVFEKDGILYRQVNIIFKEHFDHFINSGCYNILVKKNLLISHEVIHENLTESNEWYATLKPERVAFVSYPYEWSFDILKDAALLTLQLLKEVIPYDIILKDATPYNIQWHRGKLIFIDTLSFEKNKEEPWIAYRQFCENFLSPLLLMRYAKMPLQEMLLAYPEGIPLIVTKSLLPGRSKFSLHTYLHIHLHVKLAGKNKEQKNKKVRFSKHKLLNLIKSLEGLINKLQLPEQKSTWSAYYNEAYQRKSYLEQKRKITGQWIDESNDIKTAIDLGANKGEFSKLMAAKEIQTIAADFDPYCINGLYREIKENALKNIQPLILDLSNPSPAMGVNNEERSSFIDRTEVDLILALALIHHLVIGKNISFEMIADMFQRIGKKIIIEFIPKEDEKIQMMLSRKKDNYITYNEKYFVKSFEKYFSVSSRQTLPASERVLYLMKKN